MKHRLLTLLAIFFTLPLFAQQGDVVLCEGFYNPWFEEGWDAQGDDWVVWYFSNTRYAGCKSREMHMFPDVNFDGTTRLITPVVELEKYDYISVQFNHCLEARVNDLNAIIGIGISPDGENWESIWEDTVMGSITQSQYLLTFDMEEWTTRSPQFSFYFTGRGANVDGWFIDNIIIYAAKKKRFGNPETDEGGFVASRSHVRIMKGGKAGSATKFSTMRKSRGRYAKVVEGRKNRGLGRKKK